jgi:TolB-like protein
MTPDSEGDLPSQPAVTVGSRYRIERELGRGGMATVYLARDLEQDRAVALKILHPDLAAALGPARFLREIQLTSLLDHPHILPVLDSGTSPDRLWYTMPYVEGESLRDRLQRRGQLGITEAVQIVAEAAGALDHAHERGVVHRDIKPENVLLSGDRVLVADFGIAKLLSTAEVEKLTQTGLSLGTPAYMSPEQAGGDSRLDGRSDVYALGCMLYELLIGEPPFGGLTARAVLARHAIDPVPSLRTVRSTVPPALEAAIIRALAKVPADRFETAGEFARALTATPSALTEPVPSADRRRVRRRAGVAILAAVAAGTAGWVLSRPAGPQVAPSASVIAVLPFAPTGSDTALLRLGRDLASTISATLDGVGEIRVVDRLTILAQTQGRNGSLSLTDAVALGRRYGASSVVAGSIARDGENVRLDVGLYSSDDLAALARAVVTGPPDSLGALTDSVTWRVLGEVWRRGARPTPSLEAITTRSVEALRAYLDGEEASVAGRHTEARAAYSRAIAADSTFWYAYFRAGAAAGWYEDEPDSAIVAAYTAHRHDLPRRERLLVEASTWDSGLVWQRDRLTELVQEYPDYWPGWFMLGDSYVHYYPYVGSTSAEARHALERVVALNPAMVYGWDHLLSLYQADRDTAGAARALQALDRLGARRAFLENERVDQVLLGRTIHAVQTGSAAAEPLLDSLYHTAVDPASTGGGFVLPFFLNTASPATQIAWNRRVLRHGLSDPAADHYLRFTALSWAARGAWDSALATLDRRTVDDFENPRALGSYRLAVLGAWLGALSPGAARSRRAAAAAAVEQASGQWWGAPYRTELAWLDGIEAMSRKDSTGVAAAAAAARRAGDTVHFRTRTVDLTPFELALGGNRRAAARRVAPVQWADADRNPWAAAVFHPIHRAVNRTAAAAWLLETGDTVEATRLLRYNEAGSGPFLEKIPLLPLIRLELARIEEAQGHLEEARRDYGVFVTWYDMPPPAHSHLVEEARAALARLAGTAPATGRQLAQPGAEP